MAQQTSPNTTLSDITSKGLSLPNTTTFINDRYASKILELYNTNGNVDVLYANTFEGDYYGGIFNSRLDYKSIIETNFVSGIDDAEFITRFLGTSQGIKFLTKQLLLQGYNTFDETSLYNPASPILASVKPSFFGLLDRPIRHIDTSNVISGVIDSVGLGGIVSSIGSIVSGNSESLPSPPRSSVASTASEPSNGLSGQLGLGSLSSMASSLIGGGDRADEVVVPIARDSIKGLLRGGTATTAYTSTRYQRLVNASGNGGLLSRLASSAISYLTSTTAIGSIVNPTQPWAGIQYRADEKTYDYYLGSNLLFYPDGIETSPGGIGQVIATSLGFGKKTSFAGAVYQRFFASSTQETAATKIGRDTFTYIDTYSDAKNPSNAEINEVGVIPNCGYSQTAISSDDISKINVESSISGNTTKRLYYTDLISRRKNNQESSDILFAYKNYVDQSTGHVDNPVQNARTAFYSNATINYYDNTKNEIDIDNTTTDILNATFKTDLTTHTLADIYINHYGNESFFSGNTSPDLKGRTNANEIPSLFSNENGSYETSGLSQSLENVSSYLTANNYTITGYNLKPIEFSKYKDATKFGYNYRNAIENDNSFKYSNLWNSDTTTYPTLEQRGFTGKRNPINKMGVLTQSEFDEQYKNTKFGPDIIDFYFYDIVNKKYIPFSATITGIQMALNPEISSMRYIGRADLLYKYIGFNRYLQFSFTPYANSIEDLLPMWKRINYLAGLATPANYTQGNSGGAIIPPFIQFTIGDFVKDQYGIIRNIYINISDDTTWETLPEELYNEGYKYGINDTIKYNLNANASSGNVRVAQFPTIATIQIAIYLVEKDRIRTGRALFGDAPVKYDETLKEDIFEDLNTTFSYKMRINNNI